MNFVKSLKNHILEYSLQKIAKNQLSDDDIKELDSMGIDEYARHYISLIDGDLDRFLEYYGDNETQMEMLDEISSDIKLSDKTSMALPITLGKNNFKQDLYAIKHLLITGRTGTGKTTLLKSILTSINHQPKNANCKIVLIDTKDFDFNGYSSEYLMTPVITNAEKAVEYLNQIQSDDEDIAIIIDELTDLIAVKSDIQDVLVNLAENPKIHIIVATRKIDLLSVDFMEMFHNRVAFNNNKIGECLYFSNDTNHQIRFQTIFNDKGVNTMTETMFTKSWFANLDNTLREKGLDSDLYSFNDILSRLKDENFRASPEEFASCAIYSILTSGFKQKTAKQCHQKIMNKLSQKHTKEDLLQIFNREPKINAIIEIWNNRDKICDGYYKCETLQKKLNYLENLPNLGPITKDHLARNLGENMVKYDIWVQRLGVVYSGDQNLQVDNAHLKPEIKQACDDMFNHLIKETGLPRGYIDAVLFKAASNGLIEVVAEKKKAKK